MFVSPAYAQAAAGNAGAGTAFAQFIPLIYLSSLVRPRDSGSDLDGPFGGHPAVSKSAPAKELREIIGGMLGPRY